MLILTWPRPPGAGGRRGQKEPQVGVGGSLPLSYEDVSVIKLGRGSHYEFHPLIVLPGREAAVGNQDF